MVDARTARVSRELFFAAFGAGLGHVEPWVVDRLTAAVEEDDAHAGDALYGIGDAPDSIYFLREGRVHVVAGDGTGRVVQAPGLVGMFDVLLDRRRARRAVALTDLDLLRVQADAWMDVLEDSFQLARLQVTSLARTVADLEEKEWAMSPPRAASGVAQAQASPSPLSLLDKLVTLAEAPLLRGAGIQPLSDLAGVSEEAAFGAGAVVFAAGSRRDRIHLVVSGEIEARRDRPAVTWRGGPGQIVCDVASFSEPEHGWEARAATSARTLSFRYEDWLDLMEEHFEMVRSTLGGLALQCEALADRAAGAP